jgi:hypothetical protein
MKLAAVALNEIELSSLFDVIPPLHILKEMKIGGRDNVSPVGKNVQRIWGIVSVSLWCWREKRAVLLS